MPRISGYLLIAAAGLAALPALADVSKNPQTAPKGRYDVDPPHAVVMFCIPHFGSTSNYCGWFPKVAGTLQFNGAQPEKSSLEASIDLARVQTRSDELDQRLRDDFFETPKFATATFKSTAVKVTGPNQGEITGDLTLHGVTKEVAIDASFVGGGKDPWGGERVGFTGTTKLTLADFAIKRDLGPAAKDVELIIDVEAVKQ